jgi:hypothetical protein
MASELFVSSLSRVAVDVLDPTSSIFQSTSWLWRDRVKRRLPGISLRRSEDATLKVSTLGISARQWIRLMVPTIDNLMHNR